MNKAINYSFREYVSDLAHYIKPYKRLFFVGFFFRLTSDIARLYPAWAISRIILILSQPITASTYGDLLTVFITWGFASLYHGFFHNTSKYFGYQVAERAALDLYKESLAHVFKLDFAWQEKENSGNKMKRIDKGLDGVNVSIRRIFDVLIEVLVNVVGIIAIFSTMEKGLSVSLFFFILTYFIVGTYFLKRAVKQERIVNKSFENLGGFTFESLNNIQTIKSLAIDKGVLNLVTRQIALIIQKIRKRIMLFQVRNGILLTYEIIFEFTVIAILAWGVLNGRFDIGLLVLFIGLFRRVSTSANELTDVTQQLALAKIWISRTMAILKTDPKIENPEKVKNQILYPPNWDTMLIKNVKFSYQKNKALHNISFKVGRNEKVGIVGLSGAGKSTLFKLFLDLYEDYQGEILLDNLSLKNIKRQSYIDHVAVVLQDTELFDMSLRDNIEIAAVKKISDKNLLNQIITMAHLDEVVTMLPNGLDTIVGEKGIKLSGGQRQRVGIARALYRQPDILLLDEATSHLDAHSEREIQKAILENMNRFTTIVIAHRLSTIRAMDKIIVLDKGKVAEEGNFEELISRKGVFAKMWQDQKI